ncbi:MAG: NAD(P)H-dependent oxidoreductase [Acidobacteriaceae bacterium]|jgi:NAD(P)H-dependent FMN reductase
MNEIEPLRVAILIGSTRQGRFAPVVANWFSGYIKTRKDVVPDVIDLADTALPDGLSKSHEPAVEALRPRLAAADAFVVITPEYNHSFPAPLKTAIDWYSKEWQAKPVAFVSYGGNAGGLRAVEQLRQVFAELHAVTVRNAVGFAGAWELFNGTGHLHHPERHEKVASAMLDQLAWWGQVLKEGRSTRPYPT